MSPNAETVSLPQVLSRIPPLSSPLPEELIFMLLAPLISPHKESRDHHLLLSSYQTAPTARTVYDLASNVLGLESRLLSVSESTTPLDLVKGLLSEDEFKPKRSITTGTKRPDLIDETLNCPQGMISTSVMMVKRTLAQCIIIENFHLTKMEVQAILLEVMRERRLVTDFGAYSTPRYFLIICVLPPNAQLWEYLVLLRPTSLTKMDQFYISYFYTTSSVPLVLSTPIIFPNDILQIQSQAEHILLSPPVRSYISSIIIALRLHPKAVSTSISARTVQDVCNIVRVLALRKGATTWMNAECVPQAVELCTRFRLRVEVEKEGVAYDQILKEVLENTRAPF